MGRPHGRVEIRGGLRARRGWEDGDRGGEGHVRPDDGDAVGEARQRGGAGVRHRGVRGEVGERQHRGHGAQVQRERPERPQIGEDAVRRAPQGGDRRVQRRDGGRVRRPAGAGREHAERRGPVRDGRRHEEGEGEAGGRGVRCGHPRRAEEGRGRKEPVRHVQERAEHGEGSPCGGHRGEEAQGHPAEERLRGLPGHAARPQSVAGGRGEAHVEGQRGMDAGHEGVHRHRRPS